MVEVCAYSLTDCLRAQQAGAGRIELCSAVAEGGLTPSAGLIQLVRARISLPLYVMIRPRGGDFLYSDDEFAAMQADIDVVKQLGADGVVLGVLRPDGTVDEVRSGRLVEQARPLPTTFHRAFDKTRDPHEALEAVIRTGAERILTSGQQPSAEAGLPLLRSLVAQAAGRIDVMAGAGVNAANAALLLSAGVRSLHLSGRTTQPSAMQFRRAGVPMASVVPDEYEHVVASAEAIGNVVNVVATFSGT